MREILDQHAERLTPAERRTIWWTISAPRAETSRSGLSWIVSATSVLTAALVTFAVVSREPVVPLIPSPAPSDVRFPGIARTPPQERPAEPNAESVPKVRPSASHSLPSELPNPIEVVPLEEPGASPPSSSVTSGGTGVVSGVIRDSQNQPVPYANVIIAGTKQGTMTDENGAYRIERVPPAAHSLQVLVLGYEKQTREGIQVVEDQVATADIQLKEMQSVKELEEIEVQAHRQIDVKSSTTKQNVTGERLKNLPVDNLDQAVGRKAGVVARGGDLHFRGGRSGETRIQVDGIHVRPPVIPLAPGTTVPNDETHNSMFFRNYGVNPFITTDEDALSTFAVDVDAASYTVTRRYVELGHLPPRDAVRVEEFVNFFPQGYPRFESEDFRILVDGAPSPFGKDLHLVRVGIKGREVGDRDRKPAQLTFVIDVSGSMQKENRLELVKQALRLLVDQLRADDRVGIVVYGTTGRVLLEPVALGAGAIARASRRSSDVLGEDDAGRRAGRQSILEAIDQLRPEGSTNAEEGLLLGYEMARRGYRDGVINRIVLCSDGVANVGLTDAESILQQTRTEADQGIHLSTIGFGMGNYNDELMERLANQGDGNYYYVDDLEEARRVFVENLTGTLQTIARDAKIQVEFDPARVLRYRLLGFENRDVADRDFRNDNVDAGEIGAGHEVTALYEVKLAPDADDGPLATVRLRYARPERNRNSAPEVREIARAFSSDELTSRFEKASPRFRLDAAVAEFAEILRGSYWARDSRLSDVLSVARSAARGLNEDAADGFVALVKKAARLGKAGEAEERTE